MFDFSSTQLEHDFWCVVKLSGVSPTNVSNDPSDERLVFNALVALSVCPKLDAESAISLYCSGSAFVGTLRIVST